MKLPRQMCHLLSLICLLGLWATRSKPHPTLRVRCHPTQEYYSEDREDCCKMCPPGSYAFQRCTKHSETQCKTCRLGEYTALWNYILECHLCSSCDHRRGLVVKSNCTTQRNTECQCGDGHHCVSWSNCAECDPHSECGPGQELVQPGSPTLDTVCRECPPGTFQSESTFEKCRRHKNCTALGLAEQTPGSPVSDSVCSEPILIERPTRVPDLKTETNNGENNSLDKSYILTVVLSITILCCVVLAALLLCSRRSRICEDSKRQPESQNAAEDRTSLESKQPLLASAPGPAGCGDAQAPEQAPERSPQWAHLRLESQTEMEHLTQRAGPSYSSPSGSAGGQSQAGTETPPSERAHPEHKHGPQPHGDLGGAAGGAYGLLSLQGCHVDSFKSKLTVNGPLYIYNGQVSPGAPGTEGQQRQEDGYQSCAGHQETGTVPQQASGPEEASVYGPRSPVCQEASGRDTQPVQEAGPGFDSRPQASGLVTPLQEEGKETHGPAQEELPRSRLEPNWGHSATGSQSR